MTRSIVILDADGVFLSERPYWDAALHTALVLQGITVPAPDGWRELTDVAFNRAGLQRVVKRHGCNSNWDLAAVLTAALRGQHRERVRECLANRDWNGAVQCVLAASCDLWEDSATTADPLEGFGVDRHGDEFKTVQKVFQDALASTSADSGPGGLRGDADDIRRALRDLRSGGHILSICTGRPQAEVHGPLQAHALSAFFDRERLITADDVDLAEATLGVGPLCKPHWFPVVCAAIGRPGAEAAVTAGRVDPVPGVRIRYVGDAVADFWCVQGARSVGLALEYVHVRSGLTNHMEERRIDNAPFTRAIVNDLSSVPKALRTPAWRMP